MGNYPRMMPNTCPRCGGGIPNSQTPGAYPGALSRTDNTTEICSDCGVSEALENTFAGKPRQQSTWVVNKA